MKTILILVLLTLGLQANDCGKHLENAHSNWNKLTELRKNKTTTTETEIDFSSHIGAQLGFHNQCVLERTEAAVRDNKILLEAIITLLQTPNKPDVVNEDDFGGTIGNGY